MKFFCEMTFNLFFIFSMMVFTSCLPEQQNRGIPSQANNVNTDSNEEITPTTPFKLSETTNFLQSGNSKSSSTLNVFSDFNDSISIRGNAIIEHLTSLENPLDKSYCLVTKFAGVSGNNTKEILVMALRVKSKFIFSSKSNEFFLQFEPNNSTSNTLGCMNDAIINEAQRRYGSTNIALSLSSVCPECSNSINSDELILLSQNATLERKIDIKQLRIAILNSLGEVAQGTFTCSTNLTCTSREFDCCVSGQCVNHGAVKVGVDRGSDDFQIALSQINSNPELITNFQEFFHICPNLINNNVVNNPDNTIDPNQQAQEEFDNLKELHDCLNPVFDEYSVCTKVTKNASELIGTTGANFFAETDDITFQTINGNINFNNIHEIIYGGKILYSQNFEDSSKNINLDPNDGNFGGTNDDAINNQRVTIKANLVNNAPNDTIKIKYLVDGTCKKSSDLITECTKNYIVDQDSNPPLPSDHLLGDKNFKIPAKRDPAFNTRVFVNGNEIAKSDNTWSIVNNEIVFADAFSLFKNQKVSIRYFIKPTEVAQNTKSISDAQEKVNSICNCSQESPCNLSPVKTLVNNEEKIVSFECKNSIVQDNVVPLNKTVFISPKTVAHRFFDENGIHYNNDEINSDFIQEGTHFLYNQNNKLKPNNETEYIGFNEIYGTFNLNNDSAVPAFKIDVNDGRNYDITTETGSFSSCLDCSTDYYGFKKVFPIETFFGGGGYRPSIAESRRFKNNSKFPVDDMLFGRACFLPATMIPWTHVENDNVTEQRRNRLQAQHFLFANGYNKDWFGFDYGSVIGSFDGVEWFSIGNVRRIKAKGNKLYLAINAYFGDVTLGNSSYKIQIQETVSALGNGATFNPDTSILSQTPGIVISSDLDSFGAQCQRFHLCETDNDCLTRLGYDYVCTNVNNAKTPWPVFDKNANEISGSVDKTLFSFIGNSNNFPKRCVYRGKGTPCEQELANLTNDASYIGTNDASLNICSSNNYCESLDNAKFNNKIARYAGSPSLQNLQDFITDKADTFGLTARVLGRPFKYIGTEAPENITKTQLNGAKVDSICRPGKNPNAEDLNDLNKSPSNTADTTLNIGRTFTGLKNAKYFAACPAIDVSENGTNSYSYKEVNSLIDNDIHKNATISQNMSTNSLNLDIFNDLEFFKTNEEENITRTVYAKNSCLRSPGASCFTDLDCAPNEYISGEIESISNFGDLNLFEQNFWKEELVCSSGQPIKLSFDTENPDYDLTAKKCCREVKKDFTFRSQRLGGNEVEYINTANNTLKVPGVDLDIDNDKRYSRVHTIYDKVSSNPDDFPAPLVPGTVAMDNIYKLRQYKTINLHNQRMCCSGHWVRKFHTDVGGGTLFRKEKQQVFSNIDAFKKLNWLEKNENIIDGDSEVPFTCNTIDVNLPTVCTIRDIEEGSDYETAWLKWFGKFELLGIPQVLIENEKMFYQPVDDQQKNFDRDDLKTPIEGTIRKDQGFDVKMTKLNLGDGHIDPKLEENSGLSSGVDNNNKIEFISAANIDKFDIGGSQELRQVFEPDEFRCCLPTGFEVTDPEATNDSCCTGRLATINNSRRCCLDDLTDLTVYTNRYVSSEGNNISDEEIDPVTGYIKKEVLLRIGPQMCCSGEVQVGSVIGDSLPIPLDNGDGSGVTSILNGQNTRRFLYEPNHDLKDNVLGKFQSGLKWNDHVYCVPSGSSSGAGSGASGVSQ